MTGRVPSPPPHRVQGGSGVLSCHSHMTLVLARRGGGGEQHLELRHQRTPDVVISPQLGAGRCPNAGGPASCAAGRGGGGGGAAAVWGARQPLPAALHSTPSSCAASPGGAVYSMLETLLPDSQAYKQGGGSASLRLLVRGRPAEAAARACPAAAAVSAASCTLQELAFQGANLQGRPGWVTLAQVPLC